MIDDPRLPDRFWSKVVPEPNTGCWLWTASGQCVGYGHYAIGGGRMGKAYRAAYEALVGTIPPGLELDHLCNTRACVNPDHLEPVTGAENVRRASFRRMPPSRLLAALEGHGWNKSLTARALGLSRSNVIERVKRYGLRRAPGCSQRDALSSMTTPRGRSTMPEDTNARP